MMIPDQFTPVDLVLKWIILHYAVHLKLTQHCKSAVCVCVCVCVLVPRSCPTLCDPMDCSPPGSSVHGILQARILEWVAIPFSREISCLQYKTKIKIILLNSIM